MSTTSDINKRAEIAATRRHEAEQIATDRAFMAKADAAFATCGLGSAPRREHGQNLVTHRAAVVDQLLGAVSHLPQMRPEWRGFNPQSLVTGRDESGANAVANVVLADAVTAYTAPVGELRESVTRDPAGREIHRFYGDPEHCWAPFKGPTVRVVSKWLEPGRGAGAPGAIVPVQTLMSDGSVRTAR